MRDQGAILGAIFTATVLAAILVAYHKTVSTIGDALKETARMIQTAVEPKRDAEFEQLELKLAALEHRVAVAERYQIAVLDAQAKLEPPPTSR